MRSPLMLIGLHRGSIGPALTEMIVIIILTNDVYNVAKPNGMRLGDDNDNINENNNHANEKDDYVTDSAIPFNHFPCIPSLR